MRIAPASPADAPEVQPLRRALSPDDEGAPYEHELTLLARDDAGAAIGFAEASIRRDPVNGCETSPVGFLEGLFVTPAQRRHGIARALVDAVADWTRAQGLHELASDALLENEVGHAAHHAIGFAETERIVCFKRAL